MKSEVINKTVLVTGASGGIGKATAQMFADAGAKVIVHYHSNKQKAEEVLSQLGSNGLFIISGDLTSAEDLKNMMSEIESKIERIDILVNNAAVHKDLPAVSTEFDEWAANWNKTITTNLTGTAFLSYQVSKHMIARGGGRIVNVSSRGAFRGEPEAWEYGASKAGLNALGQSMAKALAAYNVFVYTVAPGFVETEMAATILAGPRGDEIRSQSPFGRVAKPEEVAKTILLLATEAPDFMTGCIVDINGASYLRT